MGNVWLCRAVLSTDHQIYFVCQVTEKSELSAGKEWWLREKESDMEFLLWTFALD